MKQHVSHIRSNLQFRAREVCSDSSICSETSDVSNTFGYQLGRFPESGLSFLGNHQDGEDPNNPLYYNWADMDSYEDVDDMYRSSDSGFRHGARNGNGLGWFSLSDTVGGTEHAHVPCSDTRSRKRIFENDDTSRLDCMRHSTIKCDMESIKYEEQDQLSSAIEGSSCLLVEDNSSHSGLLSFSNNSSCPDGNKYIPKAQIDEQNKKLKSQKQSGKSRNQLQENESCFYIEDISESGQNPTQEHDSKPFGYLQGDTPYLCSVYSSSSDISSLNQPPTGIQPEDISLTSLSLDDLYASDEVQFMKGSGDARDQMYQNQGFEASSNDKYKDLNLDFQMSMFGTISIENLVNSPTKNECKDGVKVTIDAKLDGSGEQENSESFELDDISVGATSFRQLQLVMSQLDPRTKLCIRDSLYRLAWSSEQRQCYESLQGGFIVDRDSMSAEGRNMNMEMETDTNPIDRSIAHLLFHKAADQSVLAG